MQCNYCVAIAEEIIKPMIIHKYLTILNFGQNLIEKLIENSDKLLPHIQMLILLDYILERTEKILFIQNAKEYKKSTPQFTYSKSLQEWPSFRKPSNNGNYNEQLTSL